MVHKNESGFSHYLILAVIVVVFAGASAAYVWSKNRNDDTQKTAQTAAPLESTDDSKKPAEGSKYMSIREWGLKLPVNSDTGLLYYAARPIEEGQLVEYVDVFSIDIDKLRNSNGDLCADPDFPIVVLAKTSVEKMYTVGDPDSADYAGAVGQFKQFDFDRTYAYSAVGFHQSSPACAYPYLDSDEATEEAVLSTYVSKREAILQTFEKVQAD